MTSAAPMTAPPWPASDFDRVTVRMTRGSSPIPAPAATPPPPGPSTPKACASSRTSSAWWARAMRCSSATGAWSPVTENTVSLTTMAAGSVRRASARSTAHACRRAG